MKWIKEANLSKLGTSHFDLNCFRYNLQLTFWFFFVTELLEGHLEGEEKKPSAVETSCNLWGWFQWGLLAVEDMES